jgi:phage terminase large subunit-like protein
MQVVDERVYDAMASALHKRPGATLVIISTAGQGAHSPLGRLRARALGQPAVTRRGALTGARGPGLRMLAWELPDGANIDSPRQVKRVNPASWITVELLVEQRERLPDLAYRRFVANQWTELAGHWLPPGAWQLIAGRPEPAGELHVGMDVQGPLCAVAWVDERLHAGVETFTGDSGPLDARELVRELAERHQVREIAVDPWKLGTVAAELESDNLPVIVAPQTDARMIPASARLHRAVVEKRLVVPDDERLRIAAANAIAKTSRRGWRLDGEDIAPVIALALALDSAEAVRPEPAAVELLGFI